MSCSAKLHLPQRRRCRGAAGDWCLDPGSVVLHLRQVSICRNHSSHPLRWFYITVATLINVQEDLLISVVRVSTVRNRSTIRKGRILNPSPRPRRANPLALSAQWESSGLALFHKTGTLEIVPWPTPTVGRQWFNSGYIYIYLQSSVTRFFPFPNPGDVRFLSQKKEMYINLSCRLYNNWFFQ